MILPFVVRKVMDTVANELRVGKRNEQMEKIMETSLYRLCSITVS